MPNMVMYNFAYNPEGSDNFNNYAEVPYNFANNPNVSLMSVDKLENDLTIVDNLENDLTFVDNLDMWWKIYPKKPQCG